jgi:hypothetical protein
LRATRSKVKRRERTKRKAKRKRKIRQSYWRGVESKEGCRRHQLHFL